MKTVCGDETTDSKRQFSMPSAGHGETFEACKAQTDSPALHVLSNSEHLRQSMHALSYFFQKVTIFFSWKDQALIEL